MPPKLKLPSPRWAYAVLGAFVLLAMVLTFESKTSVMAIAVGKDWASRERFPCAGLTGSLTALPLLVAMNDRLSRAAPGSVVMLGDSTFTSSPGCGDGELAADQDFSYHLKSELGTIDVLNFGIWSADWQILSLQSGLLRSTLGKSEGKAPRVWLVLTNFPIAGGSPHPVLFSQLCHSPSCGRTCRELCFEEGPERGEGVWSLFRYLPWIAQPVAGLASFIQTFVSAAPSTIRPVERAGDLGWRTLQGERKVTALYEREILRTGPAPRGPDWKQTQYDILSKSVAIYRKFAWEENGPLQLWYKNWMSNVAELPGKVVFVSQMPNPETLDLLPEGDRQYLQKMRDWQDRESQKIVPGSKLVSLKLAAADYADLIHWSAAGTAEAGRQIAKAILR